MSIESDISSVKNEVKQISKTNSDLKSDIRQMKADVAKIKASDPGPFLALVKGAALVAAFGKVDKLTDKVTELSKLAEEKVKNAKAAKLAEEERLALAKEQDRRLQLEHDNRMEMTRKETQQRNTIVELWKEYQLACKEPDLIKRFFAIKTLCSKNTTLDVSAVKEPEILSHYTEFFTGIKTLLSTIKKEAGQDVFSTLDRYDEVVKKLNELSSQKTPCYDFSHIAVCKECLNNIQDMQKAIPSLVFDIAKQHVLSERIVENNNNSSILASIVNETKLANLYSEKIGKTFCLICPSYGISTDAFHEVLNLSHEYDLLQNDWALFFERVKDNHQIIYSDEMQCFLDMVAEKSNKDKINLKRQILTTTLQYALPNIIIAESFPIDIDIAPAKQIAFLPIEHEKFVVFFEHCFFWIDSKKELLALSNYLDFGESLPSDVIELLNHAIEAVAKLGFVISPSDTLSGTLLTYSQNYDKLQLKIRNEEKLLKEKQKIISDICSFYAKLNMKPQLQIVETSSNTEVDIIATTPKKQLIITSNGFELKTTGFKPKSISCSWEKLSQVKLELKLSKVFKWVTFYGETLAISADKRYRDLLLEIVNVIYPSTGVPEANQITNTPVVADNAPQVNKRIGWLPLCAYILAGIWMLLGMIISAVMIFAKDADGNPIGIGAAIAVLSILFIIPSGVVGGIGYLIHRRAKQ